MGLSSYIDATKYRFNQTRVNKEDNLQQKLHLETDKSKTIVRIKSDFKANYELDKIRS